MTTIVDPTNGRAVVVTDGPNPTFTAPNGSPYGVTKANASNLLALARAANLATSKKIILAAPARSRAVFQGAVSLPSSKSSASGRTGLEKRLGALERLVKSTPSQANNPATRNAKRAARLVACPDELRMMREDRLPTLPSPSSALRYSHKCSGVGALTLDNFNMIVQAPGQTLWCLRISAAGTYVGAGDLLALNFGRSDFTWTVAEAGLSAIPAASTATRRLVPGYHLGYQASSTTAMPMVPAPVQYNCNTGTSAGRLWFMIKDGSGNYSALNFYTPQQFLTTVIGDCTVAAGTGASSATYPLLTTTSAGATTVFTPLIPSTGQPVRDMLQLTGAMFQSPGDTNFYPSITAASNIRLQSMASALASKFAVVSYAVGPGREGIFNTTTVMSPTTTTAAVSTPVSSLASRARQHSMGILDPDNDKWYAVNLASRIASVIDVEAPIITDFACIASPETPDTLTATAWTPAQDVISAPQICNYEGMGWGGAQTMSIHLITNGASTTAAGIPVEYELCAWLEAYLPPDTGLHTSPAMYHPDFINWLQAIGTYPVLACADSFKDYLKNVWESVKIGAREVGRHVYSVGKNILRDAAVEAIIAAARMLA